MSKINYAFLLYDNGLLLWLMGLKLIIGVCTL